jgi:EAL domain-containing protein (putative c-di-GMP-specific phosphodiesterase class I)
MRTGAGLLAVRSVMAMPSTGLLFADPDFSAGLADRLRALGCPSAATADTTLAACLARLDAGEPVPDVLVCGMMFPDGDGLRLIRELGSRARRPALLIVTRQQRSVVRAALRLAQLHGVTVIDVLPVPVEPARLDEALRSSRRSASPPGPRLARSTVPAVDAAALVRGRRILPLLQPKMRLDTCEVVGFEALMRARDADGQLIGPAALIPALEAAGLVADATMQMAEVAVDFVREVVEQGLPISVSLNAPLPLIADPAFCNGLAERVRRSDLDPSWFTVEITESDAMGDVAAVVEQTGRIRMQGFNLSIDDFGTAFASLQQLAEIPFTELKLEKSFIDAIDQDRVMFAIVSSCAQMGRALDLSVVAEGVETVAQMKAVARAGVTTVQGYLVGRPMPREQARDWLLSLDAACVPPLG